MSLPGPVTGCGFFTPGFNHDCWSATAYFPTRAAQVRELNPTQAQKKAFIPWWPGYA